MASTLSILTPIYTKPSHMYSPTFEKFFPSFPCYSLHKWSLWGLPTYRIHDSSLFAGWEEMRYVGWEGLMVARLIVERVTLSRCFQTDVHGEDYSSGNNECSMQGNWCDYMVLWGVTSTDIPFLNPDFSEFSGFMCASFLLLSLKQWQRKKVRKIHSEASICK